MYRKINNISKILTKGSYSIFRIFILFAAIVAFFFKDIPKNFSPRIIIINSIINYALSLILIYVFYKKMGRKELLKGVLPLFAIVISFLFVFYGNDYDMALKVITLTYYIYIWKKGLDFITEDKNVQMISSELVITYMLMFLLGFCSYIFGSIDWYLIVIKKYLLIFIVLSILELTSVNLTTVYGGIYTNTINKTKNIFRFNIISIFMVSLILILVLTNFFGFGNLKYVTNLLGKAYEIFGNIIVTLCYPLAWLLAKLAKKVNISFFERINSGKVEIKDNKVQDMYNTEGSLDIEPILMVLKWMAFIIIGLVIIYIMYKKIRDIYISNKSATSEDIEKEFILNKKDIKKGIKKPFKKIGNIMSKYIKGNNLKNLPVIRRLYAEKIIELNKQGYEYRKHYTPNEFMDYISSKKEEKSLELLTKYYNSVRYGNKNITEKEIKEYMELNKDN